MRGSSSKEKEDPPTGSDERRKSPHRSKKDSRSSSHSSRRETAEVEVDSRHPSPRQEAAAGSSNHVEEGHERSSSHRSSTRESTVTTGAARHSNERYDIRVDPYYMDQQYGYSSYHYPYYPPPPPPPPPMPAGRYPWAEAPLRSAGQHPWDEQEEYAEEEEGDGISIFDQEEEPESEPKESETITEGGFDDIMREFESDAGGEPLSDRVAKGVNDIWRKPKDSDAYKNAAKRAKKPTNTQLNHLHLNDELLGLVSAGSKTFDGRLKSLQSMLCKAAVPAARLLDKIVSGKMNLEKEEQKLAERELVDTISLIAHTNNTVNYQRQDAIKRRLPPHYSLALKAPEIPGDTLFGDECSEKLRKAGYGSKIQKDVRQYQQYQRENRGGQYRPQRSRGRGADRGNRTRPYPQRGGRGAPFLGENSPIEIVKSQSFECTKNWGTHIDLSCYRVPTGLPPAWSNEPSSAITESQEEVTSPVGQYLTKDFLKTIENKPFRAGQLATKADEWRSITSDPEILQHVRNHHIELNENPVQNKAPMPYHLSEFEKIYARKEIKELLEKGVISAVDHTKGEYISNIFFREKRDSDKLRMILNIKQLNKFVDHEHFKMDTLRTALQLVEQGDWFISIDFSDAYYSIPVIESHRKYLRFMFEDVLYQYNVVPNGLKTGPRLFTKILKVPLATLRQWLGLRIVGYLDDTLIMGEQERLADEQGLEAAKLFTKLGFHINPKKSSVVPSQKIEYLGFEINSKTMTVRLTKDKALRLLEFIRNFKQKRDITIRDAAGLLGKLLATEPGNPWALLYIKRMETEKSHALRLAQGDFEATMTFTDWALKEQNIITVWAPVRHSNPNKVIYTDASKSGWGWAHRDTKEQGGGRWSQEEAELHINVLELKAVYLSLRSLCKEDSNIHIQIMSDNSTTVANINVEADQASRVFNDGSEWALSKEIFQSICRSVGMTPTVDMFASRLNTKLQMFVAWQPDPDAWGVDAFTMNWETIVGFYFPPFNVVGKVLEKLEADNTMGIVVVPHWPTQPWFTKYVDMASGEILYFDMFSDNLFLPFRTGQQHALAGKTKLLATICRSKGYGQRASQTRLSTSSQHPNGKQLPDCTRATLTGGLNFVRRGKFYQPKALSEKA